VSDLLADPWLIRHNGNEQALELINLSERWQISDRERFIHNMFVAISSKYMIDLVLGAPSLGNQLKKADSLRSTTKKLLSLTNETLGNVAPNSRASKFNKLLNVLDSAAGIQNENILKAPHTEDILKDVKQHLEYLETRLSKLEDFKTQMKTSSGKRTRKGTRELWKRVMEYWKNELKRPVKIKASGGQKELDMRYSGDFLNFAWELKNIIGLESNSKHALGSLLTSLINEHKSD